jgi:hypothetical protein
MNPGIEAVRRLAHLGYKFTVNGETIKACYEGPGKPDPAQVRPLFAVVRENKPEVMSYLSQNTQATLERVLTCHECDHFRPAANSPNPSQAWGYCKLRGKGRYGAATACEDILRQSPHLAETKH